MTTTTTEREMLDVPAAAKYLGTGERFIRRLISERRIQFVRVGRFIRLDTRDLDAFLDAGRVGAVETGDRPAWSITGPGK